MYLGATALHVAAAKEYTKVIKYDEYTLILMNLSKHETCYRPHFVFTCGSGFKS